MADFPPTALVGKEDSKHRQETQKDPAMRNETEGGYVITRPRYTRRPRKTFTIGFTNILPLEKTALMDFYDSKKGGSLSFTWTDQATATTYTVRFNGAMTFTYAGYGPTQRWNVTNIVLEEV